MEWQYQDYTIDDDNLKTNIDSVYHLLLNTYWAHNRTFDGVKQSILNSMCFNIHQHGEQVGFARVVTDYTYFAWIADVIIAIPHRGKGLGKFLMHCITEHPQIPNRMQVLRTKDAHGLYEKYGFLNSEFMCKENK